MNLHCLVYPAEFFGIVVAYRAIKPQFGRSFVRFLLAKSKRKTMQPY